LQLHFTSLIGKHILYGEKINFKATLLKHGKQPLPEIFGSFSFQNLPHMSQVQIKLNNQTTKNKSKQNKQKQKYN